MSRFSARVRLCVVAVLVVSCTPTVSGPALPRPTPLAAPASTTTLAVTTTPAASEEDSEAVTCPTEFCLVYHIDRSASWSDGQPVTASDFAYTAAVLGEIPGGDTDGYRQIEQVDVLNTKMARVVFGAPYGPWQTLFRRVFRDGQATDDVDDIDTTGPFAFVEWQEGESITLQRKPGWWADVDPISGNALGDVREIRFVFLTLEEMVDALEAGEVDVISARPDVDTVNRLGEMPEIEMTVAPGPFWEHIDFHHDDPILSQRWAREAVSLAIDREGILDATVRLIDPTTAALDNTVWMTGSPHYEPHFEVVHDPERARAVLEENGCALGGDGVFVCQGRRMSFLWASTNDDPARQVIFETVREDLIEVGIELVAVFRSPSEFVTRDFLFGGPDVWQLVNFSWRARSDPFLANPTYYCDDAGALNVNRYCSATVESSIRSTGSTVEPSQRAAVYNTADRRYLNDLAVIPLYQKPTLMAWDDQLTGPDPNFNFSGDLWDIASWSGLDTIVVGLSSEPVTMSPLSLGDDNANTILGALLYGAFGMDASQEYQPVLVDSVEVIGDSG